MSKVRFNIPTFMTGSLPTNGSTVKADITLVGTDNVTVIVKESKSTIYTEKPSKFFVATINDANKFPYQFVFPQNTLINSTSTQFTTPNNSIYVFSDNDGLNRDDGKITKNVLRGTIEIRPPVVQKAESLAASAENTAKAVKSQANTFVDNTVLLEASLAGSMNMMGFSKESPFFTIGIILYKLVLDMIVVVIFWILFVSIGCWLTVPSELIYPTKIDEYPYMFYKPKKEPDIIPYYDYLKPVDDLLCKPYAKEEIEKSRERQEEIFSKLKGLDPEQASILKVIYPGLLNMDEKSMPKIAAVLQKKCDKTELCTMDYLSYFSCSLVFYDYLYCNKVIGIIHDGFGFLTNKVFKYLSPVITTIGFAVLLYYLFLSVGEMNKEVIKVFRIQIPDVTDMNSAIFNQFLQLLVSVLTCCFTISLPLSVIFIITSFVSTAYILAKSCLFPFNATILILSFMTFFFSLSQYVYIVKKFASGLNPIDLLEKMYVKDLSIHTFISFLGVTVPIIVGLTYGFTIGSKIFFSFFQLVKHPNILNMLKKSCGSVVMVGLTLLLLHVKKDLGPTYFFMTFFIILLVGLYVLTKK